MIPDDIKNDLNKLSKAELKRIKAIVSNTLLYKKEARELFGSGYKRIFDKLIKKGYVQVDKNNDEGFAYELTKRYYNHDLREFLKVS